MHCANATTTGPHTQLDTPAPADDRTPYRVTFVETITRTLDVLARDEREAETIAAENTEYALPGKCVGFDIARVRSCFDRDFCAVNE
jgi:hypothetical protein